MMDLSVLDVNRTIHVEYRITGVGKPRMTQRDKWKGRECVRRYYAFKDEIREYGVTMPKFGYHVIFIMPMPEKWSKKKRAEMCGKLHETKPDKDNLEKALLDAVFKDDSVVSDGRVSKIWGEVGKIIIRY